MRIIHHVVIDSSPQTTARLLDFGIKPNVGFLVTTFDIEETDARWPELKTWIASTRAGDMIRAEFTAEEIAMARRLELSSSWHHGYPQPNEGEFGYLAATYNLSDYCEKCGSGAVQRAPFQMKGEPKWGRKEIVSLNWVFDELFVTPRLWEKVFKPFGVECCDVLSPGGKVLNSVVQLQSERTFDINENGLPVQRCAKCQRTKFLPTDSGPSPSVVAGHPGHYSRSRQSFGGGGISSHGLIYISRDLADALLTDGAKGAHLQPVAE
jgi:hypothetical protein